MEDDLVGLEVRLFGHGRQLFAVLGPEVGDERVDLEPMLRTCTHRLLLLRRAGILGATCDTFRGHRITISVNGYTYACSVTNRPTNAASASEWKKTKRRMSPSWLNQPVAVDATTIDCASIILPMTPPALLAAPIRLGLRPSWSAATRCMPPNKTFDAVSDPVSATPSQPISVPKNG